MPVAKTDVEQSNHIVLPRPTQRRTQNNVKMQERIKLLIMILMTFFFFGVELVYGHISGSMALVADSFHMLSDVLALIVALTCIIMSTKKRTKFCTSNNSRIELLGALVNGVFLLALCFMIFLESIERLIEPHPLHEPRNVLIVGVIGFFINLMGICLFHGSLGHSHGHSHGISESSHGHSHHEVKLCEDHCHGDPIVKSAPAAQMNIRGVYLHIMTDFIGSIIVILTAAVSIYLPQFPFLRYYMDPFLSLILVWLANTVSTVLVKETICGLLQSESDNTDVGVIIGKIVEIPGIHSVGEFHVWKHTDGATMGTIHIEFATFNAYVGTLEKVKSLLLDHGVHVVAVEPWLTQENNNPDDNAE